MHCAEIAALNFSDHSLLHPLCSWSTCSVRRRARLCRVCGRWCRAAMRPRGPHALPTSGVIVAGACLMLCSIPCQHRAHALMCVTVQAACHTVAGRASIGTPCSQLPNSCAPRMSSWTQQQRPSGASVVFRCRCCRSDGSMNCQLACACLSRAVNLCIKHLMRVLLSCRASSSVNDRQDAGADARLRVSAGRHGARPAAPHCEGAGAPAAGGATCRHPPCCANLVLHLGLTFTAAAGDMMDGTICCRGCQAGCPRCALWRWPAGGSHQRTGACTCARALACTCARCAFASPALQGPDCMCTNAGQRARTAAW